MAWYCLFDSSGVPVVVIRLPRTTPFASPAEEPSRMPACPVQLGHSMVLPTIRA